MATQPLDLKPPEAPKVPTRMRLPYAAWALLSVPLVLFYLTMSNEQAIMWHELLNNAEASHGPAIPFVSAYLIWQRRGELARLPFSGTWLGLVVALAGLALALVGRLGSVFSLEQYALIVTFIALVLTLTGRDCFRALRAPLLLLLFMVPPTQFLLQNMSTGMQLLSSRIGVWFIRLFGVSVHLEGNVIDLGIYKLQVAEACDGLRYLFPLMTLGFIVAYLFHAALWKRLLLFLSTIPLTILMNSFRVGIIGVTVDRWGIAMAEGFLHTFQGWMVFMVTIGLLMLEMMALARIGPDRKPWREVFGFSAPPLAAAPAGTPVLVRPLPRPFLASVALVLAYSAVAWVTPPPTELRTTRAPFVDFPLELDGRHGHRAPLDQVYLDDLKLDDYLLADYTRDNAAPLNLYVAWYDSQQGGRSAHSPRSCLPGGGWQIESIAAVALPGVSVGGVPLHVNRVLTSFGNQRQLVYYWFQQRGRVLTNEYVVKWYLFADAITRHRTDGALVRLTAPVPNDGAVAAADAELTRFASQLAPVLPQFAPK